MDDVRRGDETISCAMDEARRPGFGPRFAMAGASTCTAGGISTIEALVGLVAMEVLILWLRFE